MQEQSATARAGSNIAITKYWGNRDVDLCIPANDSISMTLDQANTVTTVSFSPNLYEDQVTVDGRSLDGPALERVVRHLDLFRSLADKHLYASVVSWNSFPSDAGIASSASGFAALTVACAAALDLDLSPRDLSVIARRGSGSAARSIFGGFVMLHAGDSHQDSYAEQLYDPSWWEICDLVIILSDRKKEISSTAGHGLASTSPLHAARVAAMPELNDRLQRALVERDLAALGEVAEQDALLMHSVMMTSRPHIIYWLPETMALMHRVHSWRAEGIPVYFTIDAGPNLHLLTLPDYVDRLLTELRHEPAVREVLVCGPGESAQLVESGVGGC
jgi:diphosphomevalonate decarboxylase